MLFRIDIKGRNGIVPLTHYGLGKIGIYVYFVPEAIYDEVAIKLLVSGKNCKNRRHGEHYC